MHLPPTLTATTALTITTPTISNITYWGSACPTNGLSLTLPPPTNTTASQGPTPLTFTLSNFLPSFGDFGASLRMCDIVALISVEKGYKVRINSRGTTAAGEAQIKGDTRMFLRGSYAFAGREEMQSIGMFDVPGPLAGPFSHLLTPVEGSDGGVESGCGGGESELDVEFQARAVNDTGGELQGVEMAVDTKWMLTTDIEVVKC